MLSINFNQLIRRTEGRNSFYQNTVLYNRILPQAMYITWGINKWSKSSQKETFQSVRKSSGRDTIQKAEEMYFHGSKIRVSISPLTCSLTLPVRKLEPWLGLSATHPSTRHMIHSHPWRHSSVTSPDGCRIAPVRFVTSRDDSVTKRFRAVTSMVDRCSMVRCPQTARKSSRTEMMESSVKSREIRFWTSCREVRKWRKWCES